MEGKGEMEEEREEEVCYCLEGCCKDEYFGVAWDWSGSCIVMWLRAKNESASLILPCSLWGITFLVVITVTYLEISRIHNLYFRSSYFELVILQTIRICAKSNHFIFLCFLDSNHGGGDVGGLFFYYLSCLTAEGQTSNHIALRFMPASSGLSIY